MLRIIRGPTVCTEITQWEMKPFHPCVVNLHIDAENADSRDNKRRDIQDGGERGLEEVRFGREERKVT